MHPKPIAHAQRGPAPCAACSLRPLCHPAAEIKAARPFERSVAAAKTLFRRGDRFRGIYAVKHGTLRTFVSDSRGKRQVTGFHFAGELVGLDGIDAGEHACDAVALEPSQLCLLPLADAAALCTAAPGIQQEFQRALGRELARQARSIARLGGSAGIDMRLADFLIDMAARLRRPREGRGCTLLLHMTREDIGSLLGSRVETVSRSLSRLERRRLIEVDGRHVTIRDMAGLAHVATGEDVDGMREPRLALPARRWPAAAPALSLPA